jgi:integrase
MTADVQQVDKLKLIERLPKPTKDNWAVQIDWIFDKVAELSDWADATRTTCKTVKKSYKDFVIETVGKEPIELDDLWNEMSLVEWRDFLLSLLSKGRIGGKTLTTLHNTVGQVMREAYNWGIIAVNPIRLAIRAEISSHRTSDYTTAFDFIYLESIHAVLRRYILMAKQYAKPYTRQNVGRDPRMPNCTESLKLGINRRWGKHDDRGWVSWDNIIWFFENEFDCTPPHPQNFKDPAYKQFTDKVTEIYGTLESVWKRLGVLSWHHHQKLILGLVFCLAKETGLNLSSLGSLKINCYQAEHELTRQPYLRYFKARSGGAKELHFQIFDDVDRVQNGTHKDFIDRDDYYLWLTDARSRRVKEIIDLLNALTSGIRNRKDFPDILKDKLIVCLHPRSNGRRIRYTSFDDLNFRHGYLRSFVMSILKPSIIQEAVERMKKDTSKKNWLRRTKIINREIKSQSFTIARFRATIATEMVKNGATIEEVQAFLGHANLSTTILYLRQQDLEISFFREMHEYINNIKHNTLRYYRKQRKNKRTPGNSHELIYETGLCSCLDPYSPSDNVKQSVGWKEGEPCRMWNQCLFCDNILITPETLPKIFAYRTKLELTLSSLTGTPNHKALPILRAISLIDAIEKNNVFTKDEILWARKVSETVDYDLLDMLLVENFQNNGSSINTLWQADRV